MIFGFLIRFFYVLLKPWNIEGSWNGRANCSCISRLGSRLCQLFVRLQFKKLLAESKKRSHFFPKKAGVHPVVFFFRVIANTSV